MWLSDALKKCKQNVSVAAEMCLPACEDKKYEKIVLNLVHAQIPFVIREILC